MSAPITGPFVKSPPQARVTNHRNRRIHGPSLSPDLRGRRPDSQADRESLQRGEWVDGNGEHRKPFLSAAEAQTWIEVTQACLLPMSHFD